MEQENSSAFAYIMYLKIFHYCYNEYRLTIKAVVCIFRFLEFQKEKWSFWARWFKNTKLHQNLNSTSIHVGTLVNFYFNIVSLFTERNTFCPAFLTIHCTGIPAMPKSSEFLHYKFKPDISKEFSFSLVSLNN